MKTLKLRITIDWGSISLSSSMIDIEDTHNYTNHAVIDDGEIHNAYLDANGHFIVVVDLIMEEREYNRMKLTNEFPENCIHIEIL